MSHLRHSTEFMPFSARGAARYDDVSVHHADTPWAPGYREQRHDNDTLIALVDNIMTLFETRIILTAYAVVYKDRTMTWRDHRVARRRSSLCRR